MHARTIYRVIGIYVCVYYNDLLAKHIHNYVYPSVKVDQNRVHKKCKYW